MKHSYIRILTWLSLAVLVAACSSGAAAPSSSRVTIAVEAEHDAGATAPSIERAAPITASVVFTISAPDMTTITRTLSVTPPATLAEDFTVPNGSQRTFSVEAQDASGTAIYSGSTTTDLSGTAVSLTVDMKPLFFTGTKLAGTLQDDYGYALAQDAASNIYVAGVTYGDFSNPLNPAPSSSVGEAFFTKFDLSGAELWTRQFGAGNGTLASGVATDASGNVIVVGSTGGNLFGEVNQGHADAFVVKFNSAGNTLWTRLIGGKGDDVANAVAIDAAGNVFVTGFAGVGSTLPGNTSSGGQDVFVAKLDASGTLQWLKQYGSSDFDSGQAIALDAGGNVYVAGSAYGNLPGNTSAGIQDAFITKVDPAGNLVSTVQFGTTDIDDATSVVVDKSAGAIYVAGNTYGSLGGQSNTDLSGNTSDMFVVKFDAGLSQQSAAMIGTTGNDTVQGMAIDASGDLFLTGSTNGAFPGNANAGGYDVVVIKLQPSLTMGWARQIGSANNDDGNAVLADRKGNALVTGSTKGVFDGLSSDGYDAFLMSYDTAGVKQ